MAAYDEELETEIRQYIDSGRPACSTFKQRLQSTEPNVLYELLKSVRGISFGSPTCVSAAAFEGELEGLTLMLCQLTPEQKCDIVGIQNSYGATALHRAVTSNDRSSTSHSPRDIVEYLLNDLSTNQQFGLVKVQSKRGYTMLHRAADSCKADIIRYTLSLFSLNLQEKLLSIRNTNNISVADASVSALFTTEQVLGETQNAVEAQNEEIAELRAEQTRQHSAHRNEVDELKERLKEQEELMDQQKELNTLRFHVLTASCDGLRVDHNDLATKTDFEMQKLKESPCVSMSPIILKPVALIMLECGTPPYIEELCDSE